MALHKAIIDDFPITQFTNQLQFNLQSVPDSHNLQTSFQKPRPIMIEKLPQSSAPEKIGNVTRLARTERTSFSSLSSERLELAMQLAKRDVKKLKNMLADPNVNYQEIKSAQQEKEDDAGQKESSKPITLVSKQKGKQEKKPIAGKIFSTKQSPTDKDSDNMQLRFFDSEGQIFEDKDASNIGSPKAKEMVEIKRLRKELQKYMRRLDSLLEEKDRQRTGVSGFNKRPDEAEEINYERKETRAAEQASRSARMLYMLQRKVQELQDELEMKGNKMKHTKKSQSLARLAAAHRSAVRALQMFVNQAPLYYDLNHGLPPMYRELGLLIQQLSLLSSQYSDKDLPHFDLDLLPRTKKLISTWDSKNKNPLKADQRQKQQKPLATQGQENFQRRDAKKRFFKRHHDWIKQRATGIGLLGKSSKDLNNSDEPTPEREAVWQAGIDAIERAKQSASFLGQDADSKPGGIKFAMPHQKKIASEKPKSVLFPHRVKKHRQRQIPASHLSKGRQFAPGPKAGEEMRFAKQTVASVLKQHPEVGYQHKKSRAKSPIRSHVPEEVLVSYGTPKQRDAEILKMASPPSKKNQQKDVGPQAEKALNYEDPFFRERMITEKELARQAWLDREREKEIQRLQILRKRKECDFENSRGGNALVKTIIEDAEEKIKRKLQPLLEKAEASNAMNHFRDCDVISQLRSKLKTKMAANIKTLSLQEKVREEEHKTSVRKRLGDIVANTAMSRGELLADMILDDIITETVHELQSLENAESADAKAALELEKPTAENIAQRIADFEKEEEQIRRRWKQLHYGELEVVQTNKSKTGENFQVEASEARPIIFTSKSRVAEPERSRLSWQDTDITQRFDDNLPNVAFIPDEMKASILTYHRQYEKYLKRTVTEEHEDFNPWMLIEKISDDIVDELVAEVEKELDKFCDEYVEGVYADEFLKNESVASEPPSEALVL